MGGNRINQLRHQNFAISSADRGYFTQHVDPREMAWVPPVQAAAVQAAAVVPLAKKLIHAGFDSLDRVSDSVEASVALVGD